jgi:hypothetical protein
VLFFYSGALLADGGLDRAMKDLRSLTTAFEAYSIDNDGNYAPPDGQREGVVADLGHALEGIYPPVESNHPDPWGHPYRFVVSDSRHAYAMYSLGPDGKLEASVEAFLGRLRKDKVSENELIEQHASSNIVFASGMLVFAPRRVFSEMRRARGEQQPIITHSPGRESDRDLQILATAIESYLEHNDGLPQQFRGRRVNAAALIPILTAPSGYRFAGIDPWNHAYEIAVSPSGRRTAVFTRGEQNTIPPEHEALIARVLRGEIADVATSYDVNLIITSLVPTMK